MRTLSAFAEVTSSEEDRSAIELLPQSEDTSEQNALERWAEEARAIVRQQARSIAGLAARIDPSFGRAIGLLYATPGHVVVCGIGKSGIIGRKIAATLASTGTPSFFVHPAEAYHGDLGMITDRDTVLLLSYSGETDEVVRLLPHFERMGTPTIALVGRLDSTLGRFAQVSLDVSVEREVCPYNLAPTNSTLATLAMGDALAVALMRAKQFGAQDFARYHPGGSLGRRLLTRVKDVMHRGNLPILTPCQTIRDSLFTMTRGRVGLALVMDERRLLGVVTDGDLRRAMQRHGNVLDMKVSEIMSGRPVCVHEDALLSEAEDIMKRRKIKALVVLDANGSVCGIQEIFDR